MRATLLVTMLALAGCIQADGEPGGEMAQPSTERQGYFTRDMTLTAAAEPDEAAVRAGSFFQKWAAGTDYPTWRAPPEGSDIAIENVTVDLTIRVTGPVAQTFRFPNVMVYSGSDDAWMSINTTPTPPILLPGQTYRYTLPIPQPTGGTWIPAGGAFGLKVVPVMHQNDAADVQVIVGGEQGSTVTWTQRAVPPLPTLTLSAGKDAAELAGSEYAGQAAPASARHRTAAPMDGTPRLLVAWLNTTETQGIPDLDLEVQGPDGTQLVFAGTPTPREMVRLREFNLPAPGEYGLIGHNYGSARAKYTIEWATG